MIPVDQTTFGNKRGNCMAAAVASIFEHDIENIPDLSGDDWFGKLRRWSQKHEGVEPVIMEEWPPDVREYGIGWGRSPRDIRHAVVVKRGKMVHDPHPDRSGLSETYGYVVFFETPE